MDEVQLLKIKLKMEVLITQREGMIAYNLQQMGSTGCPRYGQKDFGSIAFDLGELVIELEKE